MRIGSTAYVLLLLLSSSSCGVIPINNSFEKAGTLKKGNVELAGNISTYTNTLLGSNGNPDKYTFSVTNVGARFGIGLTDKTDLKFRYEHMVSSNLEGFERMSYYSIIPKFTITADEFSLLVPLSLYHDSNKDWYEEAGNTTGSIAPQLLYTFTNAKKKADLTLGVKGDLLFGSSAGIFLFSSSLGAGFSNDLTKWAIRPEIGATFIGGSVIWSYGLGFQYTMPTRRR